MSKTFKIWILSVICFFCLSGCGKKTVSAYRAVTAVDISFRYEDMLLTRHYTQSDKMESVLLYLRLLKPLQKDVVAPDPDSQDVYDITVRFSDGTSRHYQQKAHRFVCRRENVWEQIDPAQAAQLYALMRHYPSDTVF